MKTKREPWVTMMEASENIQKISRHRTAKIQPNNEHHPEEAGQIGSINI